MDTDHIQTHCVHCDAKFDVGNKASKRRHLSSFIDTLHLCYGVRNWGSDAVKNKASCAFLCSECVNMLTSCQHSWNKFNSLKDKLLKKGLKGGLGVQLKCDEHHDLVRDEQCSHDTPNLNITNDRKRPFDQLETPPREQSISKKLKQLLAIDRPKSPDVKVAVTYKSGVRNSTLSGPLKSGCKFLVMRNYSTAISHLKAIPAVQKAMVHEVSKLIKTEAKHICEQASLSILRHTSPEACDNFSWDKVFEEMTSKCPITLEIMKCAALKEDIPKLVTSLAILLFIRNRQMNLLQTVNSISMFRGRISSKVYVPFNRSGLCLSHTATLRNVEGICNKFDEEVEKCIKIVNCPESTRITGSATDEHNYSATDSQQTAIEPGTSSNYQCITDQQEMTIQVDEINSYQCIADQPEMTFEVGTSDQWVHDQQQTTKLQTNHHCAPYQELNVLGDTTVIRSGDDNDHVQT